MKNQTETVRLWLIKGDHDIKIGKDEFTTDNPATDAICFHMQQCVEKYLKGFLVFHGKEIERTHNISRILQECKDIDVSFSEMNTPAFNRLSIMPLSYATPTIFICLRWMKQMKQFSRPRWSEYLFVKNCKLQDLTSKKAERSGKDES
jgi:hypothetical protein